MTENNLKRLGDYIRPVDVRNRDLGVTKLVGLTIDKAFIPSVANTIGTDLSNYKVISENQFACSLMQVSRDGKMPIAMFKGDPCIMSPAYPMFEVSNTNELMPEYLMMWFSRSEFDREASFYAVGGVRGSLEWNDFCDMQIPVPAIEKQREIVAEYNTLATRIETNKKLIATLEQTAQTLYRHTFVDNIDPNNLPNGWRMGVVCDICEVRDGTHDSPKPVENGFPLVTSAHLQPWHVNENEAYFISKEDYEKINERSLVETYDILCSMIGTIGLISYVSDEKIQYAVKNMAIFKTSWVKQFAFYLLFFLKSDVMESVLKENMTGSTQSYVTLSVLRSIPILIPSLSAVEHFSENVNQLLRMIVLKDKELRTLTEMQTLLLSKMGV